MLTANSRVIFNTNNINLTKKLGNQAIGMTAEALRTDIMNEQLIPFDTGATQTDMFVDRSRINQGIVAIKHTLNYAARIYFHPEFNFQKVNNANAQALWWEMYIRGSKNNFCRDNFNRFYRQLLNNATQGGI